ncbi:MAG: DNA-directed RNA polymerase subunit beta, partial [Ghiorsea sp.]|nr:DNA-directed RNA polymerase subunit beta [Ghiorsea sp.]
TSIHIEELNCVARQTKLGDEEVTSDIPNVSEDALRHLDESGIAFVGAEVTAGDILVGKITPKGESQLSPEEKLLRAIFGEKASDVRDSSLRVKPGDEGVVIDVQVFTRRGDEKNDRAKSVEEAAVEQLYTDKEEERRTLEENVRQRLQALLAGKKSASVKGLNKGDNIPDDHLASLTVKDLSSLSVDDDAINTQVAAILSNMDEERAKVETRFEEKVAKVREGSELKPGELVVVKVFIAVKRKLQPGDKMAGRHGNKGVISVIVPEEDMPYAADGTSVDVCLNPLGVPSRMNIGQIFEVHMGHAAKELGRRLDEMMRAEAAAEDLRSYLLEIYEGDDKACASIKKMGAKEVKGLVETLRDGVPIATPVFDGAKEADITRMLDLAEVDLDGQTELYDGYTGEKFDRPVTVGQM